MNSLSPEKASILLLILFSLLFSGCKETAILSPTPTIIPTMSPSATATSQPPTLTPTPTPTATTPPTETQTTDAQSVLPQNRAAFVSETYPDNSVLEAGESFTKAFELRNAGSAIWTTDYALVRDETDPAGETLGAAERIALPQAVAPGETLTLEIPLTAPEAPGTYTVYWTLQDEKGNVISVDAVQRVWVTIRVCDDGEDCSVPLAGGGGGPSANGVSFSLYGISHDESITYVGICITVENPSSHYYITSQPTVLILDGREVRVRGASAIGIPSGGVSCYNMRFEVTPEEYNQATHISFMTQRIEGHWKPQQTCNEIRPTLMEQYPGLSFECPLHDYYRNLILPSGMTKDEAHQIIIDAIVGAIYGPWELIIR